MAGRKPPGTDWETWVDAVVREARDRGEFDDLPGGGKPIEGLDQPFDEMWRVRRKLKEEGVSFLPPALQLRKDKEDTLDEIHSLDSEARVRERLEALNERIRALNRRPIQGPPSTVMPVDVDALVPAWNTLRHPGTTTGTDGTPGVRERVTATPAPEGTTRTSEETLACALPPRRWLRRPGRRRSS